MPSHADSSLTTLAVTAAAPFDTLFVQRFTGRESLDGLFLFEVECRSADSALDLDAALGQHLTVTLRAGAGEQPLDGLCAHIRQRPAEAGFALYQIALRPWLWWLTLASNNRIFQAKSVPDIVAAVFAAHAASAYEDKLSGTYAVRDYCVQYNETDFAFVSRLLEEEGIFYFFRHAAGRHILVLGDGNDAFLPCPGGAAIAFMPPEVGGRELQAIRSGELGQQAVSAAYRSTDFAFATPATSLFAKAEATAGAPGVYDYPGGFGTKDAADALVKKRVDALGTQARVLRGDSDSRALAPGHTFTLSGHERGDANTQWLVTELEHDASHQHYRNSFAAMPLASSYRPARATPRPRIHGAQTALVVGKSGEEIWTDEHGRVKVQFHWDRDGKRDENSSCWVRVAQMASGPGWGAQFIPRIGQEVVVSFLDGDPDRPLVTGCVYNGANGVPYALPAEHTKSTIKSQSLNGSGGYNEIRFEDKQDAEELYLRAQKDMKTEVVHDALRTVGNDDTATVRQNQALEVEQGNRSVTVTKGSLTTSVAAGDETHGVKGRRSVTVGGDETHVSDGDFTHTVKGNYTLTVSGRLTIAVSGDIALNTDANLASQAGMGITSKAGTDLVNQAGMALTNEAGTTLSNKGGASQLVDGGAMLTLKGGLVKIN